MVLALVTVGWVMPGASGLADALHVYADHGHEDLRSARVLEVLLHGHFHDGATPEHAHPVWFAPAAPCPARVDAAAAVPVIEPGPPTSLVFGQAGSPRCDAQARRVSRVPVPILHCAMLR